MMTLYLVRHGEFENPQGIVPWRLPGFGLSSEGIKQIKNLANYFVDKKISVIYSSPILRCQQSAKILEEKLKIKITTSSLIIETFTPWQYKSISIKNAHIGKTIPYFDDFHKNNGGETILGIYTRFKKLVDLILKKHVDKNIILVSHGDPIMIYFFAMIGKSLNNWEDLFEGYYIKKGEVIKLIYKNSVLESYSTLRNPRGYEE